MTVETRQQLWARLRRWLAHPLTQAGLAIGVAGAGRIALNSFVSFRFGTGVFGQYAATVSGVILIGSLAAAGPGAATTLGVARRWVRDAGILPNGLLRFLISILLLFLTLGIVAGLLWASVRGAMPPLLWMAAVTSYVWYQVGRAFGYAVQLPEAVTRAEVIGALVPLGAAVALAEVGAERPLSVLLFIFAAGPGAFLVAFWWSVRRSVRVRVESMTEDERRAGIRESVVFFIGAGSSMAMQYLPVIIAGRLGATTTAAVLFGAVQATTPLLLFSRVYGTVMMPAFAGDADDGQSQAHLSLVRPFFVPSLAVALGVAPWVVASLGLAPRSDALSVGALVALMTLMQVWATPAVTILSARRGEFVPALASLGGLVVAILIWVVGVRTGAVLLLPVGLAVGAVIRSLVPMWVISGHHFGQVDASRLVTLLSGIGVALVLVALGRASTGVALAGGAALVVTGLAMAYGTWRRGMAIFDANPSR